MFVWCVHVFVQARAAPAPVLGTWTEDGAAPRPQLRLAPLNLAPATHSTHPTQTHHPGWTLRTWDVHAARALASRDFPFLLPAFDAYSHPVQRADAARWMILYTYGGVYMDTDVECFWNMEGSLAGRDLVVNCESGPGERDGIGACLCVCVAVRRFNCAAVGGWLLACSCT